MYDEIYLEADEEITSAVEKIRKSKKRAIALCLPRHSQLGQSIVNLKLLFKEAHSQHKEIGLVSPDTSIRNLAERVGFSVFSKTSEIDFPKDIEGMKPKNKKSSDKEETDKKEKDSDRDEPVAKISPHPSPDGLKAAGFTSQSVSSVAAVAGETSASGEAEAWPEEEDIRRESEKGAGDDSAPSPREDVKAASGHSSVSNVIPTRGNLRMFRKKKRPIWIPIASVILVLLGVGVASALFIPNATVTLSVFAQPFNETVKSSVDTQSSTIDFEKGVVPGKAITVELTSKSSTKATGKKDLGEKATGTVTIYNEWDSSVHTFSAGTRIRATNGNEYTLNETVSVPGASSTVIAGSSVIVAGKKEANVTALSAGENYNIAASRFIFPNLPKAQQEKIYASSTTAFTGGTTRVVSVATQTDIDTVLANVKKVNVEEATKQLKDQAGEAILLDAAVQTLSQEASASVAADAETESVEGSVKGTFKAIAFSSNDQKQLQDKLLENKIPDGQKIVTADGKTDIDTAQFTLDLVADNRLELTNNLKAFTATRIDENKIRRDLIATKKDDVKGEIEKNNVPLDKIDLAVSPGWWPRMPLNGSKIKLNISYTAQKEPATETPKVE